MHAGVWFDDDERVKCVRCAPPREQPLPKAPAVVPAIGRCDEEVQELGRAFELQLDRVGGTREPASPQDIADGLVSGCFFIDEHDRLEATRWRAVERPDPLLRGQGVALARKRHRSICNSEGTP